MKSKEQKERKTFPPMERLTELVFTKEGVMMKCDDYRYWRETPHWKVEKSIELFEELKKGLGLEYIELDQIRPYGLLDGINKEPFLHIMKSGMVRIRRLSHLSEMEDRELIEKSDEIYFRVMLGDEEKN